LSKNVGNVLKVEFNTSFWVRRTIVWIKSFELNQAIFHFYRPICDFEPLKKIYGQNSKRMFKNVKEKMFLLTPLWTLFTTIVWRLKILNMFMEMKVSLIFHIIKVQRLKKKLFYYAYMKSKILCWIQYLFYFDLIMSSWAPNSPNLCMNPTWVVLPTRLLLPYLYKELLFHLCTRIIISVWSYVRDSYLRLIVALK